MEDSTAILEQLEAEIARADSRVVAVWLFGSFARGEARPGSDVDLAVLRSTAPRVLEDLSLDLEDRLERVVGRQVQIVVINESPVDLVHRVLRDGLLLLDRDPSCRVRFEVQKRNEYFDLLPHIRRYRRMTEATS